MKQFISDNLFDSKGRLNSRRLYPHWIEITFPEQFKQICDFTKFLSSSVSIAQRIYHVYHNLSEIPKCPICNKPVTFETFAYGYNTYCNAKCANLDIQCQEKIKQTCLKKYGVEHSSKTANNQEKRKQTNLMRYGVEYVAQHTEFKKTINKKRKEETEAQKNKRFEKQKQTCLKKYGVNHISLTSIWKQSYTEKHGNILKELCWEKILTKLPEKNLEIISSKEEYFRTPFSLRFRCLKHQEVEIEYNNTGRFFGTNINCYKCAHHGISKREKQIVSFLFNYLPETDIIQNSRKLIPPKEIDIYIPSRKVGIEFHGLYWHSELTGNKHKLFHLDKLNNAEQKEIKLIQIFEDEWLYKQEIVQSIILSKLGLLPNKIYARKCVIAEISPEEARQFLNENHLQGQINGNHRFGLKFNNELVCLLVAGKRNISKSQKSIYELLRLCSKLNTNVVGGASKLLNHLKSNVKEEIISYADKRYSGKGFYEKLGFELQHESLPNYWYFNEDLIRHHRFGFRKNILEKKLLLFDANLSEWKNMQLNGFDRIWDCGNYVYKLR